MWETTCGLFQETNLSMENGKGKTKQITLLQIILMLVNFSLSSFSWHPLVTLLDPFVSCSYSLGFYYLCLLTLFYLFFCVLFLFFLIVALGVKYETKKSRRIGVERRNLRLQIYRYSIKYLQSCIVFGLSVSSQLPKILPPDVLLRKKP